MFNIEGLGNKKAELKPWAAAQWYLNVGSSNSKKVVDIKNKTIFVEEKLATKKDAKSIFSSIAKITSYIVTLGALPSAALFINWIYSSKYKITNFEIKKQDSTLTSSPTEQKTTSLSSKSLNAGETITKLNNELSQKNQKIADLEKQINEMVPPLPLRDEVYERLQSELRAKDILITHLNQQLLGKTPPLPLRDDEASTPNTSLSAKTSPNKVDLAKTGFFFAKTKPAAKPKPKPSPNAGRPLPTPPITGRFTVNDGTNLSNSWLGDFTNSSDLPDDKEVQKQNKAIEDLANHVNITGSSELTINLIKKILKNNGDWNQQSPKRKQEIINEAVKNDNLEVGLNVIIGESIQRNSSDKELYEATKSEKARNVILETIDKEKIFNKTKESLTIAAVDKYLSSLSQPKEVDTIAQEQLRQAIERNRALWNSAILSLSICLSKSGIFDPMPDDQFEEPNDLADSMFLTPDHDLGL